MLGLFQPDDLFAEKRSLRHGLARLALDARFSRLLATPRLVSRGDLWRASVHHIGAEAPVTVFDFGVYQGRSTNFWARHFISPEARFHGFDSFEGLPSDWTPNMPKGKFSTGGAIPQLNDPRVSFHQGWIQNTLPEFLKSGAISDNGAFVVHIDTDIYSAALFILTTLWHKFDSYFVVFDEFGVDENLALADFSEAYPVQIEFFCHTINDQSKLPQQVFGSITRVEYKVD